MTSRYGRGRYPPQEDDDALLFNANEAVAAETDEEDEGVWPEPRLAPRSLIVRRPPGGFGSMPPFAAGTPAKTIGIRLPAVPALDRARARAASPNPYGQRQVVFHQGKPSPPQRQSQTTLPSAPAVRGGRGREREESEPLPAPHRIHWLLWVGLFMLILLTGYVLFTTLSAWWQLQQVQWQYGMPRTFQTNAAVGHGLGQSHFIVLNLGGQVDIIECPAQDCTKAVIYPGPRLLGPGAALMPVTLSFADVNGDGKPDMLVHIAGQTLVWLNTGKQFRQATASDHLSLPEP